MVKNIDEALEMYKKTLRRYKKLQHAIFGSLPDGCNEIFLPAEQCRPIAECILRLQGMAQVLKLGKREVRRISKEIGVKENNPPIRVK